MKFEIPQIRWEESLEMGFDGCFRQAHISKNTYFEYAIQKEHGLFYCYYGNGRFKEFDDLDEAKDWVQHTHYPDQVKKYFRVFSPSNDEIKAVLIANGFKEKEQADGTMDLNPYVYTSVRELLK